MLARSGEGRTNAYRHYVQPPGHSLELQIAQFRDYLKALEPNVSIFIDRDGSSRIVVQSSGCVR